MLGAALPKVRYLLADKAYDADHWRGLFEIPAYPAGHSKQVQQEVAASVQQDQIQRPQRH